MSNSRDPNEWDPEGSPDFSEFPPHYNTEQNFKNLWPTDWSDGDCRQDFRIELQQEKKNMVSSGKIPVERITAEIVLNLAPIQDK